MPLQALFGAAGAPVSAPASFCRIGGLLARSSHNKEGWAAGKRCVTISVAGGGELLLRGPSGAPTGFRDAVCFGIVMRAQHHADLLAVRGFRRAHRKRWVVQSSNSEQGKEILEEKTIQNSEENNGPPVLTIIAGLLVLFVVLWALGSLGSWIVRLLFKS